MTLWGHLSYDIQLHGFIDSDWAGSADDRRSATWICFSLSFATMSWILSLKSHLHMVTEIQHLQTTISSPMDQNYQKRISKRSKTIQPIIKS